MIWGIIKGMVKSALGIDTYTPASSTITTIGGLWALTVSVIFIACLIKMLSTAFKGSSVEQVDYVDNAKKLLKQQQRKQQQEQALRQAEQKRTVVVDRVIKK